MNMKLLPPINGILIYIKPFFAIALFFLINSISLAQTPEALMKSAEQSYQKNDFQNAVELYKKVVAQGFESGALYYNLGNSYFKTGQIGYAIYYYEKGLKLEPNDEDLEYNLRIANARTVDKISEVPKLFIIKWWDGLITLFSVASWSILLIMFFILLLTSLAFYFFSSSTAIQKVTYIAGSLSLSVLIFLAVIVFARVNREASTNYGILFAESYSAKVSPDQKANNAFVIHEGIKFAIEDQVNGWYKIKLADGKVGWIEKNSFGNI
jgi:tetratricopeptide (TPR) repeat protein